MAAKTVLTYIPRESPIHRLSSHHDAIKIHIRSSFLTVLNHQSHPGRL